MSRSYKKNMASGVSGGNVKKYKKTCHGRFRAKTRICIHNHSEVFSHINEAYKLGEEEWAGNKTGRMFYCTENEVLKKIESFFLRAKYDFSNILSSDLSVLPSSYLYGTYCYYTRRVCDYYGIEPKDIKMLSRENILKYIRREIKNIKKK